MESASISNHVPPRSAMFPGLAAITSLALVRKLEWRESPRVAKDRCQQRAQDMYTRGVALDPEFSCARCQNGSGPMKHCVVAVHKSGYFVNGSCSNCYWHHNGIGCSFRETPPCWLLRQADLPLGDLYLPCLHSCTSQCHRVQQNPPTQTETSSAPLKQNLDLEKRSAIASREGNSSVKSEPELSHPPMREAFSDTINQKKRRERESSILFNQFLTRTNSTPPAETESALNNKSPDRSPQKFNHSRSIRRPVQFVSLPGDGQILPNPVRFVRGEINEETLGTLVDDLVKFQDEFSQRLSRLRAANESFQRAEDLRQSVYRGLEDY